MANKRTSRSFHSMVIDCRVLSGCITRHHSNSNLYGASMSEHNDKVFAAMFRLQKKTDIIRKLLVNRVFDKLEEKPPSIKLHEARAMLLEMFKDTMD